MSRAFRLRSCRCRFDDLAIAAVPLSFLSSLAASFPLCPATFSGCRLIPFGPSKLGDLDKVVLCQRRLVTGLYFVLVEQLQGEGV